LSGIRRGWCPAELEKSTAGCSVPTLALLTACREVRAFYKRWITESRRNHRQERHFGLVESAFALMRAPCPLPEIGTIASNFKYIFYPDINYDFTAR
jgi:hypothetical protein